MTRTRYMTIQAGPAGTQETLRVMGALARDGATSPAVRSVANGVSEESIRNGLATIAGISAWLDAWIRAHYKYADDGEVETIKTPDVMIQEIHQVGFFQGDCDDCSTLIASILTAMGFRARFVAMRTLANDPNFLHVFTEVFSEKGWLRMDPTVRPGLVHVSYGNMIEEV